MHFLTRLKFLIAKLILKTISLLFKINPNKLINFKRNKLFWRTKLNDAVGLSLFIFGSFEKNLIRKLISKLYSNKNLVVIDIGANIGAFCIVLAKEYTKKIKIYSYEACKENFKILKFNVKRNRLNNKIKLQNCIISSDKNVPSSRYPILINKKDNISLQSINGISGNIDQVQRRNLIIKEKKDIKKKLFLLKIDTDGSEFEVLRSCNEFIKNYNPQIIAIELNKKMMSKKKFFQILKYLENKKYKVEILGLKFNPKILKYDPRNLGINYLFFKSEFRNKK